MNKTRSLFVMKFGKAEHMQSLLEEGLIYMNSTNRFRLSPNPDQGDKYEGAGIVHNGKIITYRHTMMDEKVFCLWHINNQDAPDVKSTIQIDGNLHELTIDTKEFTNLADTNFESFRILIIKNHKEFNTRLVRELNKHYKGHFWCKQVSYYNPMEAEYMPVSPFMKPIAYKKQNELRYLVLDDIMNADKPLEIRIGNISDIAQIFPVSQVKMRVYSY